MASDAYWAERSANINPPIFPMPDGAFIGNGPAFAISDALCLGALGREEESRSLLEGFFPSLLARLSDESEFDRFPEHEKLSRLANLRTQAHIAYWLLNGTFDHELSQAASDAQLRSYRLERPSAKPDPVVLLQLMLFQIEAEQYGAARKLYEQYEKSPIAVPPESARFSRNPRSLLYAHLRAAEMPQLILREAFANFRAAATKWEKDVCPIVHVMLPEAARLVSACLRLTGGAHGPSNVFPFLR